MRNVSELAAIMWHQDSSQASLVASLTGFCSALLGLVLVDCLGKCSGSLQGKSSRSSMHESEQD